MFKVITIELNEARILYNSGSKSTRLFLLKYFSKFDLEGFTKRNRTNINGVYVSKCINKM